MDDKQSPELTDKEKLQDQKDTIAAQVDEISSLQNRIESSKFDLPLLKIADDILMVPLVGAIDSVKSQTVMEDILQNIKLAETRVVVIDIAGINVVDSSVAAHLIKIAKATRLMGSKCLISGLSPVIAQNIVNLGVDTSDIETTNTLKDAMKRAYHHVGLMLVEID